MASSSNPHQPDMSNSSPPASLIDGQFQSVQTPDAASSTAGESQAMSTPWPCPASDHLIQIAANSPLKKIPGLTSEPDVASPLPPLPPPIAASPLQELTSNDVAGVPCLSSNTLHAVPGFASPPPVRLDVDGEGGFAQLLASADSAVSSAIPPTFALDTQSTELGAELGALPSRSFPLGGVAGSGERWRALPAARIAGSREGWGARRDFLEKALQPPVAAAENVTGQFVARHAVAGQAVAGQPVAGQLVTGQLIVGEGEATRAVGGGAGGSAEGTWGRAGGTGGDAHCVGANGEGAGRRDESARFWESYVAERAVAAGEMVQRNWGEEGRGWWGCMWRFLNDIADDWRDESRLVVMMERYKVSVDCFFAVWFVLGNIWVFGANSAAQAAPRLYNLSVVFLTLSCISYAMPFLLCATICCCLPCIITLMGFDNDIASISPASKGAAPDEIASLPCFKYKELKRRRKGGSGGGGKGSSKGSGEIREEVGLLWAGTDKERVVQGEDAVCCICLGHYKDGAELRQLPCNHHFHQSCVDTWLRINASCPLCKVDISGRPKEAVDPVLANEFAAASFV
ncbi:unnamed protein product [Closterium sp. Yama58-4]|nr:unnamed protein product [Closterium sp. Yama58-4]